MEMTLAFGLEALLTTLGLGLAATGFLATAFLGAGLALGTGLPKLNFGLAGAGAAALAGAVLAAGLPKVNFGLAGAGAGAGAGAALAAGLPKVNFGLAGAGAGAGAAFGLPKLNLKGSFLAMASATGCTSVLAGEMAT